VAAPAPAKAPPAAPADAPKTDNKASLKSDMEIIENMFENPAPTTERLRKRDAVKGMFKKVAEVFLPAKETGDVKYWESFNEMMKDQEAKAPPAEAPAAVVPPKEADLSESSAPPAVASPAPASTGTDWFDEMLKNPANYASGAAPASSPAAPAKDPPAAPAVVPSTPASTGKESGDLDWLDEMTKDPKNFASAPAPADAPPKERRRKRDIVKGILKKVVDAPKAIGDIKWRAPKANDDFSWASSDKGDERSEAEEKTSEAATPEKTAADKAEDLARLEAAWMRGWKLAEGGLKR